MDTDRPDSNEPQAPAKLIEALRRLPSDPVFIPPSVDQRILSAARRHLEKAKPSRGLRLFPGLVWPALAAVLVVALWIGHLLLSDNATRYARYDLNRDGQVDVVDALLLATRIRDGHDLSSALDLNDDGLVDHRDVEVLVTEAVNLENGRRS
jgi:hypothetical protein